MKVKANGILINYELTGKGRTFTFIHGSGDNLNAWYNQVPVFSKHYQVLTYDVRGHGQTEVPPSEITDEAWVADLYGLLSALKIKETILLGYSMGGGIAINFTIAHPEMIKALILSNSGITRRSEEEARQYEVRRQATLEAMKKEGMEAVVKDRIGRIFSPGFADKNPQVIEKLRSLVMQNDTGSYIKVMMKKASAPPDLSKIHCPTLIIAGEYDQYGSPKAAKTVQEAIRGSQLKVFSTGHPTAWEQPREYNETILKFLSGIGLS